MSALIAIPVNPTKWLEFQQVIGSRAEGSRDSEPVYQIYGKISVVVCYVSPYKNLR